MHQHTRAELDSHADTCSFGSTCLVIENTGRTVSVEGFGEELGQVNDIPIVQAAVAYDCPATSQTYILLFNESLYIPSMTYHLLNPNQMRLQGIIVNDIPLQMLQPQDRTLQQHSLLVEDPQLHIPLSLRGIMSGFVIRTPTWDEMNDPNVLKVHMTSDQAWEPQDEAYPDIEGTLRANATHGMDLLLQEPRDLSQLQVRGQVMGADVSTPVAGLDRDLGLSVGSNANADTPRTTQDDGVSFKREVKALKGTYQEEDGSLFVCPGFGVPEDKVYSYERPLSLKAMQQEQRHHAALEVDRYAEALMQELGVTELGALGRKLATATTTKKRPGFVDAETLARHWRIGKEAAKRTIEATTQLAVRDFTHTTGGRRLKPSHWVLNHKRLESEVYTDTLIGKCKSLRGNNVAQIYATPFHYVRAFPLKSKKDAHESLDDFFHQVGVPQVIIPDNAKELTQSDFKKKCRKAQCPIHPIEAYTPNANIAEGVIRELKRHYRRVMLETAAPEVLWDYCLEWCALVRSHTALNIPKLNGRTPATMMTGDTSDISFLAEFGWYDWV